MAPTHFPCGRDDLLAHFGQIDIYLFDQLLRGQITHQMRVLDAGCGGGRNSQYLMRCGADVYGVDAEAGQVDTIRAVAAQHAPHLPADNFRVCRLTDLPFSDAHFEAVICNAVLHFAADDAEFEGMVEEMWRVLGPGGIFFARLASTIGIQDRVIRVRHRRYRIPDGTELFLVDEDYLLRISADLGAKLLDPMKTTYVQDRRAMTTWVLEKHN